MNYVRPTVRYYMVSLWNTGRVMIEEKNQAACVLDILILRSQIDY